MPRTPTATPPRIRRSVALPRKLVQEATLVAPPELKDNLNRLVVASLHEFVDRRKAAAFETAMARMAEDPAIRKQSARMEAEFENALLDGLPDD